MASQILDTETDDKKNILKIRQLEPEKWTEPSHPGHMLAVRIWDILEILIHNVPIKLQIFGCLCHSCKELLIFLSFRYLRLFHKIK